MEMVLTNQPQRGTSSFARVGQMKVLMKTRYRKRGKKDRRGKGPQNCGKISPPKPKGAQRAGLNEYSKRKWEDSQRIRSPKARKRFLVAASCTGPGTALDGRYAGRFAPKDTGPEGCKEHGSVKGKISGEGEGWHGGRIEKNKASLRSLRSE